MRARIVLVGTYFSPAKDPENTLRIRIDCIPELGDPGYEEQLVYVPSRPLTPEEVADTALAASVPKEQRVNPILCVFEKVPPNISKPQLKEIMLRHLRQTKARVAAAKRTEETLAPSVEIAKREWIGLEVVE
jgi:hypothetical protein